MKQECCVQHAVLCVKRVLGVDYRRFHVHRYSLLLTVYTPKAKYIQAEPACSLPLPAAGLHVEGYATQFLFFDPAIFGRLLPENGVAKIVSS